MSKWSVVEEKKKAKIFETKKDAMKYYMTRKKITHTLMMVLHYKDGKWVGVARN